MKWIDKLAGWFGDNQMGGAYKSHLQDAFIGATQGGLGGRAIVATADGLTTGLITDEDTFVIATNGGSADNIITLPLATSETRGRRIAIYASGGNVELRTPASSNQTINNVDSDGSQEALLTSGNFYYAIQTLDTGWILTGYTNLGAVQTAIVPD